MKRDTRRYFLKKAAASSVGLLAARSYPLRAMEKLSPGIALPLSLFGYPQVQLLDGPFREQFVHNHKTFLELNEDAMLKPFRKREGLSAPGPDMGGWYDLNGFSLTRNDFHGFIAGHTLGQYVSGLARAYAVTGSKETQAKVNQPCESRFV